MQWDSDAMKECRAAHQANIQYKQTMGFLKPLFKQLKKRQVVPEMRAGLWIMVEAMLERNYLYAYDIYMRLAIGEPALHHSFCLSVMCCQLASGHSPWQQPLVLLTAACSRPVERVCRGPEFARPQQPTSSSCFTLGSGRSSAAQSQVAA